MRSSWLILFIILIGCTSSRNSQVPNNGLKTNQRYVYYRGDVVGTVEFKAEVLSYSADDNFVNQVVVEEIDYYSSRYKFEYIQKEGKMVGLTVKKYSKTGLHFQPGDSYSIQLDVDGLHRTYFKSDGETIRQQVFVQEPALVANAQDAFYFIARFWNDYYKPFFEGGRFGPKHNQLPSLGHELFRFDKI